MEALSGRARVSGGLHHSERVDGSRRPRIGRSAILVPAILLLTLTLSGGYLSGENGYGSARGAVLQLVGVEAAPNASASLRIGVADPAGNRPLQLSASRLPHVPDGYFKLLLVERGGLRHSCGAFRDATSSAQTTVTLSMPYRLSAGDRWIVTEESPAHPDPGTTVLRELETALVSTQGGSTK